MELWCHSAASSPDPFEKLFETLEGELVDKMEAGFAYASLSGAIKLARAIANSAQLVGVEKCIFVGTHQGITEPKAVEKLAKITDSKVYLINPSRTINAKSLGHRPIYHPKYCVVFDDDSRDHWLIGSANLTGSAIGLGGNLELGGIFRLVGNEKTAARKLHKTWSRACKTMALKATPARLAEYTTARRKYLKDKPEIVEEIEQGEDLSIARSLFLTVGAANGIERHQVEFPRKVATFFGKPSTNRVDLRLVKGGQTWAGRPLTPKTTTFDVTMYRLGMPTVKTGGEAIAHRVIKFTRTESHDKFAIDVADVGTAKVAKWRAECARDGGYGKTAGGREYGYVF